MQIKPERGPSRTGGRLFDLFWAIRLDIGRWQKNCSESYSRTWEKNQWTKQHAMLLVHALRLPAKPPLFAVLLWKRPREKFGRQRRDYKNVIEAYRIETLLHITCQFISESKDPRFCCPRFNIWFNLACSDDIFEVCRSATKFCSLANNPVAGFLM